MWAIYILIGTRIMSHYELNILWLFPQLLTLLVLSWLYWSFAAPRWLAWAYQRVENKRELRNRAIAARLIWPVGHRFNKTMIIFPKDKTIINQANQEIDSGEAYKMDIDQELAIYITPMNFLPVFIFFIILDTLAIYVFFTSWSPPDWTTLGLCLLGIAILTTPFFFKSKFLENSEPVLKIARMYFSKQPIIEIFEKGISIKYARTGLIEWKNIRRYSLTETNLKNVETFILFYKNKQGRNKEVEVNFEYSTFDAYTLSSTLDYHIQKSRNE